jgi:hypothetical protein
MTLGSKPPSGKNKIFTYIIELTQGTRPVASCSGLGRSELEEICAIVYDYAMWYSEAKDYGLDEIYCGFRILGCYWGCFYPLSEFVDCYQHINVLS